MDPLFTLILVALGAVVSGIILYVVVRLAIKHALRSHALWIQAGMPAKW